MANNIMMLLIPTFKKQLLIVKWFKIYKVIKSTPTDVQTNLSLFMLSSSICQTWAHVLAWDMTSAPGLTGISLVWCQWVPRTWTHWSSHSVFRHHVSFMSGSVLVAFEATSWEAAHIVSCPISGKHKFCKALFFLFTLPLL